MCFLRRSKLPFGRPQTHQTRQTRPQAYMLQPPPSHVFFAAFETAVWPPANLSNPLNPSTGLHASARPQPCVFYGVRDCRLAARKPIKPLKPVKPVHRPTCLSQAPAMCFLRACTLWLGYSQYQTWKTKSWKNHKTKTWKTKSWRNHKTKTWKTKSWKNHKTKTWKAKTWKNKKTKTWKTGSWRNQKTKTWKTKSWETKRKQKP